jgi:hypothetical protein
VLKDNIKVNFRELGSEDMNLNWPEDRIQWDDDSSSIFSASAGIRKHCVISLHHSLLAVRETRSWMR